MTTDNHTPDPAPALLSTARLAEIRERVSYTVIAEAHNEAIADRAALLAHLDALTPRAVVDGEALGRVVWEERRITFSILNPGIPLSAIQSWEGLLKDAKDERTERAKVDECIRIGLALHAIGYAAGAVAMTGEGDDPGTEGAVLILMKRHDAELHAAHAAGRSEGEAERAESAKLALFVNTALADECAALRAIAADPNAHAAEAVAREKALHDLEVEGLDATIARLTAELAEAQAAVDAFRALPGYPHTEGVTPAMVKLRLEANGAREERDAILHDIYALPGAREYSGERATIVRAIHSRATEGRRG